MADVLDAQEQLRFCQARRAVIEREFARLNPEQRKAVLATEGPLLLLAGAGSGKTTVLIHRVANLIKYGRGSDCEEVPPWVSPEDLLFLEEYASAPDISGRERAEQLCRVQPAAPWSILAITFTNKAAGELKARLENMLGPDARDVWASTFHSCCARILRRDIDRLGYEKSFTIYDTADTERVVKDAMQTLQISERELSPRSVLGVISRAKDALQLAPDFAAECDRTQDFRLQKIAKIYMEYEKRLRDANALDFDDLILQTVLLLKQEEDVRNYYQRKFRYVLVDEYQDTNNMQYELASLLAGGYQNFCVVGDDDQSIYRFRGATIENILSFEGQYKGCRTIRLEQNYRSTQNILEAANAVIRNNLGRKGKELWTEHEAGARVSLYTAQDQDDESQYIAARILAGYSEGQPWRNFAILYRMNAQSRELEMSMKRNGIPYKIIGGVRFFDRAEVKDMLAYLCVLNNPGDNLRLQRIINNPPRGIGNKTVETAQILAVQEGLPLWDILVHAAEYTELQKSAKKIGAFVKMMERLRQQAGELSLPDFYAAVCADTGYAAALEEKKTPEAQNRLENVRELGSSVQSYSEDVFEPSLAGFLDEIALFTDLDTHDPEADSVVMMTIHSAKGLEFPSVFVAGMEEGIFPGFRSMDDRESMGEERRLCYVAMTRAKERLTMTCTRQRMFYGRTSSNRPSRFLEEIPEDRLERSGFQRITLRMEDGIYQAGKDGGRLREEDWRPERQLYRREESQTRAASGEAKPERRRRIPPDHGYTAVTATPVSTGSILPGFKPGDTVRHKAFGKGVILTLSKMGNDALIEVAFDDAGTKKLMLKAASQYMEKL